MSKIVDKNVFKIVAMLNNLVLACVLFTLYDSRVVFSAKTWFVKTSIRIVKYKSQVTKLNPDNAHWNYP